MHRYSVLVVAIQASSLIAQSAPVFGTNSDIQSFPFLTLNLHIRVLKGYSSRSEKKKKDNNSNDKAEKCYRQQRMVCQVNLPANLRRAPELCELTESVVSHSGLFLNKK